MVEPAREAARELQPRGHQPHAARQARVRLHRLKDKDLQGILWRVNKTSSLGTSLRGNVLFHKRGDEGRGGSTFH